MNEKRGSKIAQIWIETVIYTLIGLSIIALLISIINPRINELKDKTILTQTVESLNIINSKVIETLSSAGNTRNIGLKIKRGVYTIDSANDSFYFLLEDSSYMYSQINQTTPVNGYIDVLTLTNRDKYKVYFIINYSNYNLTYNDKDTEKVLTGASAAYNLIIENKGNKQLNFKLG